jgi:gamma-glutamylcyclotransferase (GGCT)/AIG2-like uncharacterized protein YtfP
MFYFAYGSNMNREQMAERCPGAVPVGLGVLTGWEFCINRRGVATIFQSPHKDVHGVVWRITEAHESTLDICESVAEGNYCREFVSVCLEQGREESTLIYVDPITQSGPAREGYLEKVIGGAIQHGVSESYVSSSLRLWADAGSR